jgi:hypothetical protein
MMNWDNFLPELLFPFRTRTQNYKNKPPFFVMFERECTGIQTSINLENSDEADMHHAFDEITKIRNTVSSEVKNNVRESQKKQVLQYAKKNKSGKNKNTPEKGLSKGMI